MFEASSTTACVTENIRFKNSSDTAIAYNWNFGDGSTSSLAEPTKNYANAGNYRVSLTGSRIYAQGFSCVESSYANVTILDTLPGHFNVSDSVGFCVPFKVNFSNALRGSTRWIVENGDVAEGDTTSFTFNTPGQYLVTMVSKSESGCTYKATKIITVSAPQGSLEYTGGFACVETNQRFEIKATGASGYTFAFGDGDTLATTNTVVNHSYRSPGAYLPFAYVEQNGCRLKISTGDTVKVDLLKAGFTHQPQYGCGSTTVQFADTSYSYFGLKSWQWTFGDGSQATGATTAKNYLQDITDYVQLQVAGVSGCTATNTIATNINVNNFPVADIGSDSVACTGQPIDMSALILSKDSVATMRWSFGNGNTANGRFVQPVFNSAGTYVVQMIATTVNRCADTVYKRITVKASPVVNAGSDQRICLGQRTQLKAFGSTAFQWSPLENLSCADCASPIASPPLTTQYIVTGTNAAGCSVHDTVVVSVVQPFELSLTANDTICIGKQTQLFAGGADRYVWSPATGLSSDTVANPLAQPIVTTPYRVIAGDAYKCFADTGYVLVVVGQYPTVDIGTGSLVTAGTIVPFEPVITNGPIQSYTWTPATNLSCTDCARPKATINNNVTYKVLVQNIYGCTATDTISFQVQCEDALQVYIPNAFSPDGDNINDVFLVRGKGIATVKYFRIFNRWGELVFERNNFNANDVRQGWDGRVNGKPANPDVYVYTAEVLCTAGGTFVRKGNVTLFR